MILKPWNCDTKIKIHLFSIYKSASSQQILVQASTEDYKLGYLGKTELEYLLGPIDNNVENLSLSGFWSEKASSLKNHCAFATNVSQKSGRFGLLQFDCNLGFPRVRHKLLLLICIQSWITPLFLRPAHQFCIWMQILQWKVTKKTNKMYKILYKNRNCTKMQIKNIIDSSDCN